MVLAQAEQMAVEQPSKEDSADLSAPSSSNVPLAETEKDEKNYKETSTIEDASLKGTALLKSLLSTSIASSVAVVDAKMITTTEVTDETLNLKKILYQPDREKKDDKEHESPTQNAQVNTSDNRDDDDRRLIIDISDEEKDPSKDPKGKSMPVLTASIEGDNTNGKKATRPTSLDTTQLIPVRPITRHQIRVQESKSGICFFGAFVLRPTAENFKFSWNRGMNVAQLYIVLSCHIDTDGTYTM